MKARIWLLLAFAAFLAALFGAVTLSSAAFPAAAEESAAAEDPAEGEEGDSPPCGHAWDSGRTTRVPTCTTTGEKIVTCILCGETQTDSIPATGHAYEVLEIKGATCSTTGLVDHRCLICGDRYEEVIPAKEHDYQRIEVDGDMNFCHDWKYECQICGAFYYDSSGTEERASHDISNASATIIEFKPTCTTIGARGGFCAVCGDYGIMEVPALGHDWLMESQTYDQNSGMTVNYYFCSRCNEIKTEEIETEEGSLGVSVDLSEILNRVAEYYQNSIYEPYSDLLLMLFGIFAGIWGIPVGISYIIARKQDDKEKAKKMLVNFVLGIVVSFCLLVAAPFLVDVFMQIIISVT